MLAKAQRHNSHEARSHDNVEEEHAVLDTGPEELKEGGVADRAVGSEVIEKLAVAVAKRQQDAQNFLALAHVDYRQAGAGRPGRASLRSERDVGFCDHILEDGRSLREPRFVHLEVHHGFSAGPENNVGVAAAEVGRERHFTGSNGLRNDESGSDEGAAAAAAAG